MVQPRSEFGCAMPRPTYILPLTQEREVTTEADCPPGILGDFVCKGDQVHSDPSEFPALKGMEVSEERAEDKCVCVGTHTLI